VPEWTADREDVSTVHDRMAPICPVCRSVAAYVRYRLPRYSIFHCVACTQTYLWPLPSPEDVRATFARLYASGECSVPELRSYFALSYEDRPGNPLVELYEHWLDLLETHHAPGRLLDIGCGTGLFLAVARRRGWTPMGVDDCVEATRYAREHFGVDVGTGNFEELAAEGAARFDVITMWDVIEHARDPVELLAAVRRCLAPGGVVALSTPNQRNILDLVGGALYRLTGGAITAPLEKFYVPTHFAYFTPATLEQVLARAGLQIVRIERELTDLRRLTLAAPVRLALGGLFRVARWTGLENRLLGVACPTDGIRHGTG